MIKSNLKTVLKETFKAIEGKDESAKSAVSNAFKKLDKAVAKGIIHKNNAANKKSALQLAYNKIWLYFKKVFQGQNKIYLFVEYISKMWVILI